MFIKKTPGLKAHFKKAGIKSSVPNKVQKDLDESFNPIKDLIYDIQLF